VNVAQGGGGKPRLYAGLDEKALLTVFVPRCSSPPGQ
jgi:hypothetical protein